MSDRAVKTLIVGRRSGKTKAMLDDLAAERDKLQSQLQEVLEAVTTAHEMLKADTSFGTILGVESILRFARSKIRAERESNG